VVLRENDYGSRAIQSMHIQNRVNGSVACSETIKQTGRFAIGCNAFAAFSILCTTTRAVDTAKWVSFYQSLLVWILLFAVWGIATGIGLSQAWR